MAAIDSRPSSADDTESALIRGAYCTGKGLKLTLDFETGPLDFETAPLKPLHLSSQPCSATNENIGGQHTLAILASTLDMLTGALEGYF